MVLGAALMAWGLYDSFQSGTLGAFWQVLIGYFIILAARDARAQTETMELLGGVTVERLMSPPPPALPGHLPAREIAGHAEIGDSPMYFPVVEDGRLAGVIQPSALKAGPQAGLDGPVRGFVQPLPETARLAPQQTAAAAPARLRRNDQGFALVVGADGRIVGWLGIRAVLDWLDQRRREAKDAAG